MVPWVKSQELKKEKKKVVYALGHSFLELEEEEAHDCQQLVMGG